MRSTPRPVGAAFLLVALLALCLPGRLAAQELFADRDADFVFGGVTFPAVVDTLVAMSATRYPDPSIGVVMHYATPFDPSARFDIFVLPVEQGETPMDLPSRVAAEFNRAAAEMLGYAQQNPNGPRMTVERRDRIAVVTPDGRTEQGWVAEAAVEAGGAQQRAALFIFGRDRSYIRFRLTYSTAREQAMRHRILAFVGESLDRIVIE